ncbi:MAG: hypothetical protein WB679_23715 [Terracidiphilus sp.]
MGLILDSSVVIAAERRGHTVRQILEQIKATHGEIENRPLGRNHRRTDARPVPCEKRCRQALSRGLYRHLCRDVPVQPVTVEIPRRVGRIEGEQASQGVVIAFEDLAIGVTALHLGFEVATFNVRHFQRIPGLKVVTL